MTITCTAITKKTQQEAKYAQINIININEVEISNTEGNNLKKPTEKLNQDDETIEFPHLVATSTGNFGIGHICSLCN